MKNLFIENMVAPCGLDCSLCSYAHTAENPCPGCFGSNTHKPEFCAEGCEIIQCGKRKQNQYHFCDECPDFPCAYILRRENGYKTAFVLTESPLGNLEMIRKEGMGKYLLHQKELWTCNDCGGVICVHNGICNICKKTYTRETFDLAKRLKETKI